MDWNDFAMRLTLELSRLPVTSFVIVQGPSGLPYVQAMRTEELFDAEAVGSAFLPRPLAPRQERRLRALGWEPPDEEERKNWWQQFTLRAPRDRRIGRNRRDRHDRDDRVSAEHLEASALLAGLMVGAFRDAYHIESPLELVYQASRAGPEGGPLTLPGLGIPLALPESGNGAAAQPSGPSTFGLETALAEARERGDQHGYLDLLARAALYLPAPGDAGAADHQFATARFGDGTFVLAFTSPEAMDHSLQGQAAHHRKASLAELARGWPHPEWRLAINPGLPSASYLDANALLEPAEHPEPARAEPARAEPEPEAPPGGFDTVRTAPSLPESPSPPPAEPLEPSGVPEGSETPTSPLGAPPPRDAGPSTGERGPADGTPQFTIMQKAVRPEHVRHYLDGGYDLVAGQVHRVEDVAAMATPEALINGLGLVYEGSPFTPADAELFVIRWPAVKPPLFRRSHPPVGGQGVPGFRIESQRLPHGAGLYRLAAGTEWLVASYDADLRRWLVKLPGGSG
ncbi:SseB family protein [Actinomadura sp. KC216]|uniref:SseB family protein n=1 Tax=Actinomadura sp. KC216 TaxID=2530370 RepID=UPI00104542A7|nr:SseB family protein [Actinomadura sp. KC216]TDB83093.1 SseB family protein [Actinomadura sp. KC216]